jgi:hypothetical protein
MTPEGEVLQQCLSLLAIRGIQAWRNNVGMKGGYTYGKKGSADITGILPGGRRLEVECKAGRGRLSPEQADFLQMITEHGGFARCVYSVDELIDALRREGI